MPWLLQRWWPWEAEQSWRRFCSWCVCTSPTHGATRPHHYAPSTCNGRWRHDGAGWICRIQWLVPGRIPGFSTVQSTSWQWLLVQLIFAEYIERFCMNMKSCFWFISSNHSTAATATRTPGTTTRDTILPARKGDINCDTKVRKQEAVWAQNNLSAEQWTWTTSWIPSSPIISVLRPSSNFTSLLTVLDLLLNKGSDHVL